MEAQESKVQQFERITSNLRELQRHWGQLEAREKELKAKIDALEKEGQK